MRLPRLILLLLAAASGADAQQVVVSPAPDSVTVTVYRNPFRAKYEGVEDRDYPGGYALVTEVRTVDLPAGPVTVRFEGVASGIQAQTAIMRGLDPREKNLDSLFLSKRGLIDAYTGQSVLVRRTNRATGKATVERARIRSGPDGVVLETAAGFESIECDGTIRTLLYPKVPPSLSAKPVLSMTTAGQAPGPTRIELSYLTDNMDWYADYVAELSEDASHADLFAWLTIFSNDDTTFEDAQALAIAGDLAQAVDFDYASRWRDWNAQTTAKCWPSGRTEGHRWGPVTVVGQDELQLRQSNVAEEILRDVPGAITGSSVRQEDIGDLKLYRIPFRVTLASRSQKQTAFVDRKGVPGQLVYRSVIGEETGAPLQIFRMRNLAKDGLGIPLPEGPVSVFQRAGGARLLRGEAVLNDRAVGEDVELKMSEATAVSIQSQELGSGKGWTRFRLTVANANPHPIRFEAEFEGRADMRFDRLSARTSPRNGRQIWSATIPANGKAELVYRRVMTEPKDED